MGLISGTVGLNPVTLSAAVGQRIVCVAHSRGGATSFSVTPGAGSASWVNRVAESTLPGDDTARRSLAIAELTPTTAVSEVEFTASWSGDSTDATWLVVEEGADWVFAGATVGDSDTGTTTTQGAGSTGALSAGDVLAIAAAAIRSGGTDPSSWATTDVNPPLAGGGNQLLDNFAGKGEGGNAGSVGYLSAAAQSAQAWSDTVTIDTARMVTAALAVWVQAAGGAQVPIAAVDEADEATPLTARKLGTLSAGAEQDTARPVAATRQAAPTAAQETDTTRPLAARKTAGLDVAAGSDHAQPLSAQKRSRPDVAAEADAARTLSAVIRVQLDAVREHDTANLASATKRASLGTATEEDGSRALPIPGAPLQLGAAHAADAAHPVVAVLVRHAGAARATDQARPLPARKTVSLGAAHQADRSLALTLPVETPAPTPPGRAMLVPAEFRTARLPPEPRTVGVTEERRLAAVR